jgi:hypothetical protein
MADRGLIHLGIGRMAPAFLQVSELMATATIFVEVDADTARAFSTASNDERRKLQLLLSLRLRELTARPTRPLTEAMDEIGRYAEAQGLTPDHLMRHLRDP